MLPILKRARLYFTLACGMLFSVPSHAAMILLYDDLNWSQPVWSSAVSGLGHDLTTVTSDSDFSSAIAMGNWDLVIAQFDDMYHPSASGVLQSYVEQGGRAIFSHWLNEIDGTFGAEAQGLNQSRLSLSPLFADGLASELILGNPGYGIFSRSFATLGAQVAAHFEDGHAAILVGNDGRSILNGFLGETLAPDDEIRLYQNQVQFLLDRVSHAIPEPSAMIWLGLALLIACRRIKKTTGLPS